ncbi:hypothetical protein [Clostridium sp. B9]|uniref:hypothetical protein n=1 Tax=Clostridium sp. B9 TaxID=3423224 RepID=UPI003D2ECE55
MGHNLSFIVGIVSILLGIWILGSILLGKKDILKEFDNFDKHLYYVKDMVSYESLLTKKSIVNGIVFLVLGIFITITKNNVSLLVFLIIFNIICDRKAKKYLEERI